MLSLVVGNILLLWYSIILELSVRENSYPKVKRNLELSRGNEWLRDKEEEEGGRGS